MATQDLSLNELCIAFINFAKTTPVDTSHETSVRNWMDYLSVFLTSVKRHNSSITIPSGYRLIGSPIEKIVSELVKQRIPQNEAGELWVKQWCPDLVGYANYLFTLFTDLTDYRVEVPKFERNNNFCWML